MPMVLADVLKLEGRDYPDKLEVKSNYFPGQKLYIEYNFRQSNHELSEAIAEFEVTGIVWNTLVKPHVTMLNLKTDDKDYLKLFGGQELLIFESDIEQHLAKNTETLNDIRWQLAAYLEQNGEQFANIELDNGRQLFVNEVKDADGKFSGSLRVSLYANSEEIEQDIFQKTHHVIREYIGSGSVNFLYQSVKRALQVNENIKTPEHDKKAEITSKFSKDESIKLGMREFRDGGLDMGIANNMIQKEVLLTIEVPADFDREDERMLDDAFAYLLEQQGWKLVKSDEYRDKNIREHKDTNQAIDCTFISVWDDFGEITSAAKFDPLTQTVFDIKLANLSDDVVEALEICSAEYVEINGKRFLLGEMQEDGTYTLADVPSPSIKETSSLNKLISDVNNENACKEHKKTKQVSHERF